jgi:membrane protease YdiL (CAAX protease family)
MIIPVTWAQEFIPDSWRIDLVGDELARILQTNEGYFVVCLLAPLSEEIVFRGAIIRAILKWKSDSGASKVSAEWLAIVVSALLFAVIHANPAQIPAAIVFGILLGWLFIKTGSIVPGCIIHWINNSFAYVMLKIFPTVPIYAHLADYFNGNQMAVAQAVIASLFIALPSLYQLIKAR